MAVRILLVTGPHADAPDLGSVQGDGRTALDALGAIIEHVVTRTEAETVAVLARACDAVVLDPGVLEHYSRQTADAVRRVAVPVVVVRGAGEGEPAGVAAHRVVTPAAAASVQGGGAVAYDAAIEAAVRLAWPGVPA